MFSQPCAEGARARPLTSSDILRWPVPYATCGQLEAQESRSASLTSFLLRVGAVLVTADIRVVLCIYFLQDNKSYRLPSPRSRRRYFSGAVRDTYLYLADLVLEVSVPCRHRKQQEGSDRMEYASQMTVGTDARTKLCLAVGNARFQCGGRCRCLSRCLEVAITTHFSPCYF